MEALQILIDMVKELPETALYVLIGFFIYKTLIVGSIYGVIKLAIVKLHDAIVAQKTKTINIENEMLGAKINDESRSLLSVQISRIKSRNSYNYIHSSDVLWLKDAIDEKLAKDGER